MRTIKTYFKRAPFYNALLRTCPPNLGQATRVSGVFMRSIQAWRRLRASRHRSNAGALDFDAVGIENHQFVDLAPGVTFELKLRQSRTDEEARL